MDNRFYLVLIMVSITAIGVFAESELYFKTSTPFDLKIPCINNNTRCSASAVCNLTINYPNGTNLIKNQPMTNRDDFFNITISPQTTVGEYSNYMYCLDSGNKGYSVFKFTINNSGNNEKPYVLSIMFILIPLLFAIVSLIWGVTMNGENKVTMGDYDEPFLEINYGWYAKLILIFASYMFFWIATFVSWQTSLIFTLTDTITGILRWLFLMESIVLGPLIIVFSILGIIHHFSNLKWLNLAKRGLRDR